MKLEIKAEKCKKNWNAEAKSLWRHEQQRRNTHAHV